MCELCRQYPCSSSCPNAPEPEPICVCDKCEEGIYEGEYFFEIDEKKYCENCINDSRYVAQRPEEEEPYQPDPYDLWRDRQLIDEAEYIISQDIFKEEIKNDN